MNWSTLLPRRCLRCQCWLWHGRAKYPRVGGRECCIGCIGGDVGKDRVSVDPKRVLQERLAGSLSIRKRRGEHEAPANSILTALSISYKRTPMRFPSVYDSIQALLSYVDRRILAVLLSASILARGCCIRNFPARSTGALVWKTSCSTFVAAQKIKRPSGIGPNRGLRLRAVDRLLPPYDCLRIRCAGLYGVPPSAYL